MSSWPAQGGCQRGSTLPTTGKGSDPFQIWSRLRIPTPHFQPISNLFASLPTTHPLTFPGSPLKLMGLLPDELYSLSHWDPRVHYCTTSCRLDVDFALDKKKSGFCSSRFFFPSKETGYQNARRRKRPPRVEPT